MFFGDELLGGRRRSMRKQARTEMIHLRPRSLKSAEKGETKVDGFPADFASELQAKSLDTILKDYQTNAFYRVKLDMLLK